MRRLIALAWSLIAIAPITFAIVSAFNIDEPQLVPNIATYATPLEELTTDQELQLTDVAIISTQNWQLARYAELWATVDTMAIGTLVSEIMTPIFVSPIPTNTQRPTTTKTSTSPPTATSRPGTVPPSPTLETAPTPLPTIDPLVGCYPSGDFVPAFVINARSSPEILANPSNKIGTVGPTETLVVCVETIRIVGNLKWIRIAGFPTEWIVIEQIGEGPWGVLEIWPD